MPRFWWPGHEMKLIGGLQRQQNCLQFCDILLQTEGISVPAHSCILAALCPQLSQKLSAFPVAPADQCRVLHLQAVKSQALRNLIALLYFGEVEVKGSMEENDLLSVTQRVGITLLVKGQKEGAKKLEEAEKNKSGSSEQKVVKDKNRKMQDVQVQTDTPDERTTGSQTEEEKERCYVSTDTQTVEGLQSPVPPPLNIPLDEPLPSLPFIPSVPSGTPRYGATASDSLHLQPDGTTGTRSTDNAADNNVTDKTHSVEPPSHDPSHEKPDEGNPTAQVLKSLVKMKEKTHLSLKMMLRRRRRRKKLKDSWEVVQTQAADETLSILTYNRGPTKGLSSAVQPSLLHNPESQIPYPSDSHNSQQLCTDHFTQTQTPVPGHVPQSQPLAPDEEPDENLEKLLEDIMMGLNILPIMERDLFTPHQPQPCYAAAPALCHLPGTESNWLQDSPVSAQRWTYPAQNQLGCSNLSSNAVYQQHQHQQQQQQQSGFCPNGKTHPPWQEPSSQDHHNIADFLLPADGSEMQSVHHFSSRRSLPLRCSALKPFDDSARRQQPPTPLGRPTCPQSDITHRSYASGSQDAEHMGWSRQCLIGYHVRAGKPSLAKMKAKKKKKKRKRTFHFKDAAGHVLALNNVKLSKETKRQISQSICTVNLSSNNMLAMEREAAACSSGKAMWRTAPNEVGHHLQRKTRDSVQPSAKQNNARREDSPGMEARTSSSKTASQQSNNKVVAPQRKRGRPPKLKLAERPHDMSGGNSRSAESEHQVHVNPAAQDEGHVKRRRVCQRYEIQPKPGAGENMGRVDKVVGSDVINEPRQTVQKLIDPQHPKAENSQNNPRNETEINGIRDMEASGGRCGESMEETETDIEMTPLQIRDETEESEIFAVCETDPTMENGRSQEGDSSGSTSKENRLFSDCTVPFLDVLEDVDRLPPESELPVMTPNEDAAQQAAVNDEDLSHGDTHAPLQGDRNPIQDSIKPGTQEMTDPPLSSGAGSIKSSDCSQVKEDEEVDIMCFSPDSLGQSSEGELFLDFIDIEEDKEEEEDEIEVDVIGD